nr:DUF724 domain-containing protein 2-like [Ipomoea batatas]
MVLNREMLFRRGDLVEVASVQEGFRGSYFEAIVVATVLPTANKYIVEYETLVTEDLSAPLCEIVAAAEVRPRPPRVRRRDGGDFEVGDLVDAYDNEGWWGGEITGKFGDKFSVCSQIRCYVSTFRKGRFGGSSERARRVSGLLLRSHCGEGAAAAKKVHRGVRDAGDGGLVGAALRGRRRRGSPAEAAESVRRRDGGDFEVGDLVDAYDNEGWWGGEIRGKIGDKYAVYFACSEEEIEYRIESLRIHLEWVDIGAEWVDPMRRGDLVEVASVQEGFRGSYFEAIVVATVLPAANKYIVEYETLVTEDLSAPLCEIVSAAEVRPRPPRVRKRDGGDFEVGDLVDAYDNKGWWAGEITGKVGDKFSVYFACSEEEIEYRIESLRIHLDWVQIRDEWVDPMRRSLVFF